MSKVLVTESNLTDIAGAIRVKLDVTDQYKPSEMAAAIESIPVGGSAVMDLYSYDFTGGYVGSDGTYWYSPTSGCYSDIYQVKANTSYAFRLDNPVSTRFRVAFYSNDITQITSGSNYGTKITSVDNPSSYAAVLFRASSDGYVMITKSNNNTSNIKSYGFELNP